MLKTKTAAESHTVMSEIVLLSCTNGSGRLFGGQIMSWMDIAGAICAKRHSGCEVVTVSVDQLSFLQPAMPNDVVVLTADLESVGNTSMRVKITAEIEPLGTGETSERLLTSKAYFTYVAIGPDGKKHLVPRLAQSAFSDAAEAMGISSEDDVQALVDEIRYEKER